MKTNQKWLTDKSENSYPGTLIIKTVLKSCKRTLSTALNLCYIKKTGSQIKYEKSVCSFEEILYAIKEGLENLYLSF